MPVVEVRESDTVRKYVLQGLWLRSLGSVSTDNVSQTLDWLMNLAASDEPVPPAGIVTDVSQLIFGHAAEFVARNSDQSEGFLPDELRGPYEDYVLGKLYADGTFERGSTAVCRYQGNDRIRGAAWLLARLWQRSEAGGIRCSPSVIRALQREPVEDLLAEGSRSLRDDGLLPLLEEHFQELIAGLRRLGEVLAPEDVFELEHETALVEFGQRLALRQVLSVSNDLKTQLPRLVPQSYGRDHSVVTNLVEEDSYPVGGFTSISTRGSIESLLQSQLAFMETDEKLRPDLFDVKYLRNELYYYSRDENQFLRRRRTFVFALYPDLVDCRIKDAGLPCQRIMVLLAVIYMAVLQLVDWLTDESLKFEILFVTARGETSLTDETELLRMLLRKHVESDTVSIQQLSSTQLETTVEEASRRSLTHCISASCTDQDINADNAVVTRLTVGNPIPTLIWEQDSEPIASDDAEELNGWPALANLLLRLLV